VKTCSSLNKSYINDMFMRYC